MNNLNIFSTRLKELRCQYEMTQKEFAQHTGCTAATLSAYENGTKNPSLEIVKNIAEQCDISIDWLCGLTDNKKHNNKIETYSELIHILSSFFDIPKLNVKIFTLPNVDASFFGFDDSTINRFFIDWAKIRKLYDEKVINKDMYEPWLNSKFQELNIPIKKSNSLALEHFINTLYLDLDVNIDASLSTLSKED